MLAMASKLALNLRSRDSPPREASPALSDANQARTHDEIPILYPTNSSDGLDGQANEVPPPARGGTTAADANDLPMSVQDAIFQHQMSQVHPLSITPQTIIAAGICGWEKDAINVHHALVKAGVLESTSGPQAHVHTHGFFHLGKGNSNKAAHELADEEFLPVTTRINSALPKQLRVLSLPAVKILIKVLFFWEEEINRWRARELDVAELEKALAGYVAERGALEDGQAIRETDEEEIKEEKDRLEQMAKEVRFRIQAVRLRRRVQPSARNVKQQLPQYESQ